ncbi:MAG: hypothetical protein HY286_11875 [Planctomycetes bacterium]|nr:hypothetical protein [Planctomycetota bacterium]
MTIVASFILAFAPAMQESPASVPSPEAFFGYPMGADGKLALYTKAQDYWIELSKKSKWIQMENMGRTTQGLIHWMLVLSDPKNLENAAAWKESASKLIEADHTNPEEARAIAKDGKITVMITCGIHSDEVAASQMASELVYEIVANKNLPFDRDKVFEHLILLIVPSVNPDGQELVASWVEKTAGTENEGAPMPYLYHYIAGHDDNRDWFAFNLAETRNISNVLYKSWRPHVLVDHHQMGARGARFFVPPFGDPLNRAVHPLVWRGANLFGQAIAYDLETAGKAGVTHDSYFQGWWEGGLSRAPWWHNAIGILTECASANLAFPLKVDASEIEPGGGIVSFGEPSARYPNPWNGGTWHVRDICDYQKIATYTTLKLAADKREDILWNSYQMSAAAVAKGRANGRIGAYAMPAGAGDAAARLRMVEMLMLAGVRVEQLTEPWTFDHYQFAPGTFVARLDQPFGPYLRDMLEDQHYPDLAAAQRPYDITGWTLSRLMGVACERVDFPETVPPKGNILDKLPFPKVLNATDPAAAKYVAIDARSNDAFRAAGRAIAERNWLGRSTVSLKTKDGRSLPAGAFLVKSAEASWIHEGYEIETGAVDEVDDHLTQKLRGVKTGIYESYDPSIDKGWTYYVVDRYVWKPQMIHNEDLARLLPMLDTFIIPESSPEVLWDGGPKSETKPGRMPFPKEFRGGIGADGIKQLKAFVERGGTLIGLGTSCDFLIDRMDLPVTNVLKGAKREDFSCPGSLIKIKLSNNNPIAFGMPDEAAGFFSSNVAFKTSPPNIKFDRNVIARFPAEGDLLLSGYIKGEEKLRGAAGAVEIGMGKGKIVLFGLRVQHRAQTDATFKLLFNAILSSVSSL